MIDNIKKLIILGLIVWGLWFVYVRFISPTLTPFFKGNRNKVNFFVF